MQFPLPPEAGARRFRGRRTRLTTPRIPTRLVGVAALVLAACARPATRAAISPPKAEFLVSGDDSTFWISTGNGQTRIRGEPLVVARIDSRWYELYTADDDYSYDDALLLGERIYRRDLLSGDSAIVFADTTVPRLAAAYARAHPDERPLSPDEDGEANPSTTATAEVDLLDIFGPYLSYDYSVDVTVPDRPAWHSVRRGVIDLRSGRGATLADLFGGAGARQLTADGRRDYDATRDSLTRFRSSLSDDERSVADAVTRRPFDDHSFVIEQVDGLPAVAFGVPGHGQGATGHLMTLDPVTLDSLETAPAWWQAARSGLPDTDDQDNDRWTASGYRVIARYDTSGETAYLSLADSANREWPLGAVQAPVRRIEWLDHPSMQAADRRALSRAFDEAATYGEESRIAMRTGNAPSSTFHLASRPLRLLHATDPHAQRKSARDLRADDARAREQHGPRVRRSDPVHHGQDGGDRGVSPLPGERGDRVHRSRGFSRTDSPRRSGRAQGERELRRPNLDGGRRQGRG